MKDRDPSLTKIPPQNQEAERAVLGAMLVDNSAILEAQRLLPADYFYFDAHRKIFAAMLDVFAAEKQVDLVSLGNALKQRGHIEVTGGLVYLSSLADSAPSALLLAHHAKILRQKAILRQLIGGSIELMELAYNDSLPLADTLSQAQNLVGELLKQSVAGEATQKLGMPLKQMLAYYTSCRSMPFESLNDDAFGGMFPGELIICGGWPGMGKSAMAHAIMRHLAIQEGWPVFYFAAEMTREKIYVRQLAGMCRLAENAIKKGRINLEQGEILMAAGEKINAALIGEHIIKDKINAIDLMGRARRFADEVKKEVGLVIVENLQQITWPGKKDKDEIDTILSALRAFGIEMKMPIYLSSQIKRPEGDKGSERPTLDQLKGSGNIEELADKVLLLHRPHYRPKGESVDGPEDAEVIIAKGGSPKILPFKFFGSCLYWEEAK